MRHRILLLFACFITGTSADILRAGLEITASSTPLTPPKTDPSVLAHHAADDQGGNTSLRFMENRKVDENKYPTNSITVFAKAAREQPQRDRDLGQTFLTGDHRVKLDALFLRIGHADLAVRSNAPGARVAVQWFEVTGQPTLNDHGTPGFAGKFDRVTSPELDDSLEGETYTPLRLVEGRLPANLNQSDYLKLDFTGGDEFALEPRCAYAFLLMFLDCAAQRGMTLASEYYGTYIPDPANKFRGHGIRREGLPEFPEDWKARLTQLPGTLGFPDVCTFRDLHFAVTVKPVDTAAGAAHAAGDPKPEIPLAVNLDRAATTRWLNKKVLASRLLDDMENPTNWTLQHRGQLSFTKDRFRNGQQSVRITVSTLSDQPNKVHGRSFGEATLSRHFQNEDWTDFNRLSFWVYPTMQGFKNGSLLAKLISDGSDQEKVSLWYRGQMSYFLLRPGEWNHIVWEIPHVDRRKITRLELIYLQQGNEPGAASNVVLDIDQLELQRVDPDYYQGWSVAPGRIAFSHTGYQTGLSKTALASGASESFSLLERTSGRSVLTRPVRREQTGLGEFQVLDFSEVEAPGEYTLKAGGLASQSFRIGPDVWEQTARKVINFFYAERCGHAIPGVHDVCHLDWQAKHKDQTIKINGGWHDAGDLSQGQINTAEAIYSMLALADRLGSQNPALAARLMTEARWGLTWLHKTRFGDGYRVVWGTLDFWTDGVVGNIDDCYGQVSNNAYENLIGCAASALAARLLKNQEPALAETSLSIARHDFGFALEKLGSPRLELASQAVLAAVELYRATGDRACADKAVELAPVIIASQQREIPSWDKPLVGFFYDGPKHQRIVNYAHRGHDQAPVVALAALCDTLPDHPDWIQWYSAVVLHSEFLRATARLDAPYGTLAAGIYHVRDNPDQVTKGLKLAEEYYLRRFPVTGDARGHFGVLLSQTKGLSAAARLRGDASLLEVCQHQLQWVVGRNPFGQSCMYGEGYDYAPQYTAMSGDIAGSLPVGIMMPGNEDFPFWPAANCWAYKEVWVHPASRWLWIVGDLLPSRALRPEPLPDCTFTLAAETATAGKITIRLSARGQGRHRFTVRAENLTISDPNQELDLKREAATTAQWTATVVNAKAPWVAVVVPDGDLVQRREVTAKINPL